MYFKHLPLVLLFVLASMHCLAQKKAYNKRPDFLKANSVWAFGFGAGLDFNSGGAVPVSTHQRSNEGCASVADPITGKLLFYSNGGEVWNGNHQMMPHGTGLIGNPFYRSRKLYVKLSDTTGAFLDVTDTIYSSMQGVCIVPVINDPDKYYLFSLSGETSGGPKPGGTLFYSIIDMRLNNGLGDVDTLHKNIGLDSDSLSESMIAIPGDNCDIWLMVHHWTREEFRAYHITKEGINRVPVISTIESSSTYPISARSTTMGISPDRTKIFSTRLVPFFGPLGYDPLLARFDPATGKVDSGITIRGVDYFSGAFSPDNTKLYFSGLGTLYQFDISNYDSIAIQNSLIPIDTHNFSSYVSGNILGLKYQTFSLMRLYNDTIYFGTTTEMHRINKPNLSDTACQFQANALQLLPGDSTTGYLGVEVVWPLVDTLYKPAQVAACERDPEVMLQAPEGYSAYQWEDGSTARERNINTPGAYWVISKDYCNPRVDTFKVISLDFPIPRINVNVTTLGTTEAYEAYQWMLDGMLIPDATNRNHIALQNGDYQIIVSIGDCVDTSEIYKVTNAGSGNAIENSDRSDLDIAVYPNPATDRLYIYSARKANILITSIDGKTILKQERINSISLQGLAEGTYFLHISDAANHLLKVTKFTKLK